MLFEGYPQQNRGVTVMVSNSDNGYGFTIRRAGPSLLCFRFEGLNGILLNTGIFWSTLVFFG